jgi:hypothetical protein
MKPIRNTDTGWLMVLLLQHYHGPAGMFPFCVCVCVCHVCVCVIVCVCNDGMDLQIRPSKVESILCAYEFHCGMW